MKANSEKISRAPNLTEQVTSLLRDAISNGVHEVGKTLPSEQAMSESFGVSRTVMREALSRLKSEGLVATRQGIGVFVVSRQSMSPFRLGGSPESPAVVLEIVELRLGVEVEAAGLAAARRTDADLAEMRLTLTKMNDAIARGNIADGVDADLDFHRAICSATQNDTFQRFFDFLSQFMQNAIHMSRYRSAQTKDREIAVQLEHRAIYEAIAEGDVDAARNAARTHIENTADRIREFCENESNVVNSH